MSTTERIRTVAREARARARTEPVLDPVRAAIRESQRAREAMAADVDEITDECLALAADLADVTPIWPG